MFWHQDSGVVVSSSGETGSRTESTLRSRRVIGQFQVGRRSAVTSSVARQNVLRRHRNHTRRHSKLTSKSLFHVFQCGQRQVTSLCVPRPTSTRVPFHFPAAAAKYKVLLLITRERNLRANEKAPRWAPGSVLDRLEREPDPLYSRIGSLC